MVWPTHRGRQKQRQVSPLPVQALSLLHLATLPKCAPSGWDQEPSSESRVTQLSCLIKIRDTSHPMPPRLRFPPLGRLAGFPTIGLEARDSLGGSPRCPTL